MKKKTKVLKNIIIAGLSAFLLLNLFCIFYYNVPARVLDESGSTDYKWPSNTFYSKWTEGIAFGTTNNDGYNNLFDFNDGDKLDALFMGSSHLEGFNVSQKENASSVLNDISEFKTYNIGISEHTLPICIENLECALKKYKPTKYVIIETMSISFYDNEIMDSLDDTNELPTYSNKIMDFLQSFKYLKLIRYQLNDAAPKQKIESINNSEAINKMMNKAKIICDRYNVKLIILYHPTLTVNEDNIIFNYNKEDCKMFEDICEMNDIEFVNMEQNFAEAYYSDNVLPHGFNNTVLGVGHLNKYGHRMIAERLSKVMEDLSNDVQ